MTRLTLALMLGFALGAYVEHEAGKSYGGYAVTSMSCMGAGCWRLFPDD